MPEKATNDEDLQIYTGNAKSRLIIGKMCGIIHTDKVLGTKIEPINAKPPTKKHKEFGKSRQGELTRYE